jgi:hypothetical protein
MTEAKLDVDVIGLGNEEFDRIEAASAVVSEKLSRAVENRGYRLWWSSGDSNSWRVIIGIPTEDELAGLLSNKADLDLFAHELMDLIGSVVALKTVFKLYLEVDSNERVDAHEGWFFRVKSVPPRSRERHFIRNDKRFSRA